MVSEPKFVERIVEQYWVYNSAEGRPRGDDGHYKGTTLQEVMPDDGIRGNIEHSRTDTSTDTLAEEDLVKLVRLCEGQHEEP